MQVNSTTGYRSRDLYGGLASRVHFQLLLPALCHPWRRACTSAWWGCHVRGAWSRAHRHGINSKLGLGGLHTTLRRQRVQQLVTAEVTHVPLQRNATVPSYSDKSKAAQAAQSHRRWNIWKKQHCLFWGYSTASAGTKSCPVTGPELSPTTGRARGQESSQRAHLVPQVLFPYFCSLHGAV